MSRLGLNCSHVGSLFILIGGIIAVLSSAVRLLFTLLVARALQTWVTKPMLWERLGQDGHRMLHMGEMISGFILIGAIVTVALGGIAIYAYTRVKAGRIRNGGLIALIVGIAMMVSVHWVMGVLTLVGGILCYASTEQVSSDSSGRVPQS